MKHKIYYDDIDRDVCLACGALLPAIPFCAASSQFKTTCANCGAILYHTLRTRSLKTDKVPDCIELDYTPRGRLL